MKDNNDITRCCPYCGGISATAPITERYDLLVDFTGSPYGQSNNKIVSGGKRFICDTCGRDVSKFIPTLEIMK